MMAYLKPNNSLECLKYQILMLKCGFPNSRLYSLQQNPGLARNESGALRLCTSTWKGDVLNVTFQPISKIYQLTL